MSNIREHLDILEFNNLSEDDQRDLAHMVLNNMHQDLEEWAQLREIDMGKIKKWIKTGALAAALGAAGISAAHANFNSPGAQPQGQPQQQAQQRGYSQQDLQHSQDQWQLDQQMRKRQQQQGQAQQRGQDQPQFQQRDREQPQQRWDQGRDQRGWDQDQRGYEMFHNDRDRARMFARERGGWEPRPRWHMENPWAMINIEPPEDVMYFRDNGQDIMFIPHPGRMDIQRARELGGMIETLQVPYWPEPIRAFVYEMDGVTYITALPGQLP